MHPLQQLLDETKDSISEDSKRYYSQLPPERLDTQMKQNILFARGWRIKGQGTFGSPYWIYFEKWNDSSNQDDKIIQDSVIHDYTYHKKGILNCFYSLEKVVNHIWNALVIEEGAADGQEECQ